MALLNSRSETEVWLAASLSRDMASRIWSAPCDWTRMPSVTWSNRSVQALDAGDDLAELAADLADLADDLCGPAR